jgi:dephospho-CoA kinase
MKHSKTAALTGGIASGKSTVAGMFHELGAAILDADVVARQVVEPGQPAWYEILDHFGNEMRATAGQLDRKKLGVRVFQDPAERRVLEAIIHPRVIAEMNHQEQQIHQNNPQQIIIADVPLLIEANMHTDYHTVMVVYVSEQMQLQRLMQRDHLTEAAARQRIAAQMPLTQKRAYATYVINNESPREQTNKYVRQIYQKLDEA